MALDTAQKRGAAMGISLPFRPWLTEPTGALDVTARLSLLRFSSSIAVAVADPVICSPTRVTVSDTGVVQVGVVGNGALVAVAANTGVLVATAVNNGTLLATVANNGVLQVAVSNSGATSIEVFCA